MKKGSKVWRTLRVWTRRRQGMKMLVSGTKNHDGVWIRPRFGRNEVETQTYWVNVDTGEVLSHYSYIPKTATISSV